MELRRHVLRLDPVEVDYLDGALDVPDELNEVRSKGSDAYDHYQSILHIFDVFRERRGTAGYYLRGSSRGQEPLEGPVTP